MDFVMPGSGKETDTGAGDDPGVLFGSIASYFLRASLTYLNNIKLTF